MGYTTDFDGQFDVTPAFTPEQVAYLREFAETRRMQRDATIASTLHDPLRSAVGLPIGKEAEYFVGGEGFAGQDNDRSILNYNRGPSTQPGLWCQWTVTDDGAHIEWNGVEKFYNYVEWLEYIVEHFAKPWGRVVSGGVSWQGEEDDDTGVVGVINNTVNAYDNFAQYDAERQNGVLTTTVGSMGAPTQKYLKL